MRVRNPGGRHRRKLRGARPEHRAGDRLRVRELAACGARFEMLRDRGRLRRRQFVDIRRQQVLNDPLQFIESLAGQPAAGFSASYNCRRPRDSRDITVPIGMSRTSAIPWDVSSSMSASDHLPKRLAEPVERRLHRRSACHAAAGTRAFRGARAARSPPRSAPRPLNRTRPATVRDHAAGLLHVFWKLLRATPSGRTRRRRNAGRESLSGRCPEPGPVPCPRFASIAAPLRNSESKNSKAAA